MLVSVNGPYGPYDSTVAEHKQIIVIVKHSILPLAFVCGEPFTYLLSPNGRVVCMCVFVCHQQVLNYSQVKHTIAIRQIVPKEFQGSNTQKVRERERERERSERKREIERKKKI